MPQSLPLRNRSRRNCNLLAMSPDPSVSQHCYAVPVSCLGNSHAVDIATLDDGTVHVRNEQQNLSGKERVRFDVKVWTVK